MTRITARFVCWILTLFAATLPVAGAVAQGFTSVSNAPVAVPGPAPDTGGRSPQPVAPTGNQAAAAVALSFSSISASASAAGGSPEAGYGPPQADKVLISKRERRLYLLKGGETIAEYPIKLGLNPFGHKQREGDFRTPEGSYSLIRRNPSSRFFLSIEVSYPNGEDRARAREAGVRPGGLIMIHGQPNVPRKAPDYYASKDWTDGCIALSNADMVDIWQRTTLGTPIEIRP